MDRSQLNQLLYDLYYTPSSTVAFSSPLKLYSEAKKRDGRITLQNVKDFLQTQFTYTLHKQSKSKFKRNKIFVPKENHQWEVDLVDMRKQSRSNNKIQYLLNFVDCFSRRAIVIPLKDKSGQTVFEEFKKLFKGNHPTYLRSDKGSEFITKDLKDLFKEFNIGHFYSNNPRIKCAIVERFNKTLKGKLFKLFTARGSHKYIDVLQDLVDGYNNSFHRSIGMAPNAVNEKTRKRVFKKLYGFTTERKYLSAQQKKFKRPKPKLKEGQHVRVKYDDPNAFVRGYYPSWQDKIYTIQKVIKGNEQPLFKIDSDKKRRYYASELQKVLPDAFRVNKVISRDKKNNRALVSFVGYDNTYNEWISMSDLERTTKEIAGRIKPNTT